MGSLNNPYTATSYVESVQEDVQKLINKTYEKNKNNNIKISSIHSNLGVDSYFTRIYSYRIKKISLPNVSTSIDIGYLENRMKRKIFSSSKFPLVIEDDKPFYDVLDDINDLLINAVKNDIYEIINFIYTISKWNNRETRFHVYVKIDNIEINNDREDNNFYDFSWELKYYIYNIEYKYKYGSDKKINNILNPDNWELRPSKVNYY